MSIMCSSSWKFLPPAPVAQSVSAPYLYTVQLLDVCQVCGSYEKCGGCEFDPHPEHEIFFSRSYLFRLNLNANLITGEISQLREIKN